MARRPSVSRHLRKSLDATYFHRPVSVGTVQPSGAGLFQDNPVHAKLLPEAPKIR